MPFRSEQLSPWHMPSQQEHVRHTPSGCTVSTSRQRREGHRPPSNLGRVPANACRSPTRTQTCQVLHCIFVVFARRWCVLTTLSSMMSALPSADLSQTFCVQVLAQPASPWHISRSIFTSDIFEHNPMAKLTLKNRTFGRLLFCPENGCMVNRTCIGPILGLDK
ncbi:hypothetical protein C8R43DRAFT_369 [Mycena crocata]|nr:hypothetical protein C8R43DRAFT_369 [Mycena crocata]